MRDQISNSNKQNQLNLLVDEAYVNTHQKDAASSTTFSFLTTGNSNHSYKSSFKSPPLPYNKSNLLTGKQVMRKPNIPKQDLTSTTIQHN